MSDEQIAEVDDQGTGQSQETSENGEVKQPEAQTYITRADVEQLLENQAKQFERLLQSRSDKLGNWTEKRIQERLRAFNDAIQLQQKAGGQIDPALLRAAKSQIIEEEYSRDEESPVSASASAQAQSKKKEIDPDILAVNAQAAGIQRALGITLNKDDPEAKTVNVNGTPEDFLETFTKAVRAKKERLDGEKDNEDNKTSAPAAGKLPAQGGGKPSMATMEEAYKKEMAENRGQGSAVAQSIKEKWRKKGLDVDHISLYR